MSYEYKTEPFSHQRRLFEETKDRASFAVLWEQGTGKTKPMVDNAAYLYERDEIDCIFVVAPGGVHRNWVTDELPAHLPDRVAARTHSFFYQSARAATKWHTSAAEAALKYKGLVLITMTYDAFMTERGKKFAWRVLRRRRCLYILDEGHHIKTPNAKRTKSIIASGKYAPYRRLLTGTPIAVGPFDIYSQVRFIDEGFWRRRGMGTFAAFKQHFGVWWTRAEAQEALGYDPGYDKLIEYKNLDELHNLLKELSDRVLKEDVLDLPEKLYSRRYFEPTREQQRLYDELTKEFMTELAGQTIEAPLAIVRLLRFAQVLSGYVPNEDDEEPDLIIPGGNPRLKLLEEIVDGLGHPFIIWARFRKDIDQITELLGERVWRYDGAISESEAFENQDRWKKGERDGIVGNPAKGKEGLTWTRAKTVIYYNNSFKLLDRQQSEDRAHRIGQHNAVNYIDIMAPGTVDEHVARNLINKVNVAAQITGDQLRDWLDV